MKEYNGYDLIIIGGGPAGFAAAIHAAPSCRVLILEKTQKPLTKFKMSGSGKCNLTHTGDWSHFSSRYGRQGRFLKQAWYGFNNETLLELFKNRGIGFYSTDEGKIFPQSDSAADLAAVLLKSAREMGVKLITGSPVTGIEVDQTVETFSGLSSADPGEKGDPDSTADSYRFIIRTPGSSFRASAVLAAGGGASYPATGSDGSLLRIIESLGQPVIPLRPALSPIRCRNFPLGSLSGLSFSESTIRIRRAGLKNYKKEGPLLITPEGLSGPVILNNSRDFQPGDLIEVSFTGENESDFRNRIQRLKEENGRMQLQTALRRCGMPASLAKEIAGAAAGSGKEELKLADVAGKTLNRAVRLSAAREFTIEEIFGWKRAMATAGGVSLKQVNPATMESKLIPGLYFAGELLDLDGETGGYNLQAAFSTGVCAANSIRLKNK